MNKEHTPVGAEARGRLRLWKAEINRTHARFSAAFQASPTVAIARDFSERRGVGQRRAYDKLRRLFNMTRFEGVRLGRKPLVVWSIPEARVSIRAPLPGVPASRLQDCVTVNFVLAGFVPSGDFCLCRGVWGIEIPDHAMGRAIQRTDVSPGVLLDEAHKTLLKMHQDKLFHSGCQPLLNDGNMDEVKRVLVRAGPGGFVGAMTGGHDAENDFSRRLLFRADTWISDDMVQDDQVVLVGDGPVGKRMIDHCLLPSPLYRIEEEGNAYQVYVWEPGLPDLKLVA